MAANIAIVGIAAELPSGAYSKDNFNHKSFFDFLLDRGESYERIPADRFNIDAWNGNGLARVHVDKGSFLKEIDLFDNVEFGVSSRDARIMAPATRKLLESCFLALLDSGIDYRAQNVGCYTSGISFDLTSVSEPDHYDARGSFAGYPAMVANRISNHLDLLGPSLPTDTACSSTITTLHLAVQALLNGDCSAAVVAGCQLNHRFIDWITYSNGSLLAKDGKCKPFDQSADGFARAEACAAIVIKPLEDALRDQDRIYATILGTAINSTGGGAPPGAPVPEAQRDAMLHAFRRAGRRPQDVDFVELHATGTAKGDPVEANWVGAHFQRQEELLIGSVKGNIGHTEIVAFLTSLSKVLSVIQRGLIPPNINVANLNPAIEWDRYKLRVPLDATPLPCRSGSKPLISMASSGIGGSNGHVVLEGPPEIRSLAKNIILTSERPVLLVAGGLSPRSTSSVAQSVLKAAAAKDQDLPVVSTIFGRRSKQMTWRSFAVANSSSLSTSVFSQPQYIARFANPVVMIFSGQGPQHDDMGKELFKEFPVFRDSILEMDEVFRSMTGKSIIHDFGLFRWDSESKLRDTWPISIILPSIAMFQVALFDLFVSLGIKPDVVVGHSAGETAMLYASGAAPKAMAVELAIIRGKAFSSVESHGGTMAALSCGLEEASGILEEERSDNPGSIVEVACLNSPSAVAIAGHEIAIDRVVKVAQSRGIFARKIHTKVPIHSSMMDACREEYCGMLQDLFIRYPGSHKPVIPVYSTLTGKLFSDPFDAQYFWDNTRSQVRFSEVVEALWTSRDYTYIELSPHPVLSSYVSSMVPESSLVLSTIRRPKSGTPSVEYRNVLELCGKLTVNGHNCVDFTALNGRACYDAEVDLPDYPFSKKRFNLYPDTAGYAKQMEPQRGPLNNKHLRVNKETHPTLAEHIIRGEPIMPAAGFMEMAIEFGASTLMNVNLRSMLSLSSESPIKVEASLDGSYWTVKSIATSPQSRKDSKLKPIERLHADGYLSFEPPQTCCDLDISSIRKRCPEHVSSAFYPSLSYFSSYGPTLRRVTNLYYGDKEALASIRGIDHKLAIEGDYILHPAILDACLQITAYKPFHGDFDPNVYYLPARVEAVIVHKALRPQYFPAHVYAHVKLGRWTPASMHYDIALVDDKGSHLCTLKGLEVAKHRITPLTPTQKSYDINWQPVPHPLRFSHSSVMLPSTQDRPTLFSVIDNLARGRFADTKMLSHLTANGATCHSPSGQPDMAYLQKEWPGYFEVLENRDDKDLISVFDGPQYDYAVSQTCRALQDALTVIAQNNSRRVVKIFITSSVNSLFNRLPRVLSKFSSMFIEVVVEGIDQMVLLPSDPDFGLVRTAKIDFRAPETQTPDDLGFDIVIAFNVAATKVEAGAIVQTCNDILVPGGTMILTERNRRAWDQGLPGTAWYNSVFGSPTSSEIFPLNSYLDNLEKFKFTVLHSHYTEAQDPFHFIIESQSNIPESASTPELLLCDPLEAFIFRYEFGCESDLQWHFSGLNRSQQLDIWIVAKEGQDGGAASGLVRALNRECPLWTIRLVVFPVSYTEEMEEDSLQRLPPCMKDESEIMISPEGLPFVPRMTPLPETKSETLPAVSSADLVDFALDQILVRIISSFKGGKVYGFIGSVVNNNGTSIDKGALVVGLTAEAVKEHAVVDIASVCAISLHVLQVASVIAARVPGCVASVLAPGLSLFNNTSRLKSQRILLTHSDTDMGAVIKGIYSHKGLEFKTVTQETSLLELATMGSGPFDLIVSGYDDKPHIQVLKNLLSPGRGKLFLWEDEATGLIDILQRDPCSIGDALRNVIPLLENNDPLLDETAPSSTVALPNGKVDVGSKIIPRQRSLFDANKTYLILGGIGSVGVHITLFMYERGARHIILTSRSGENGLRKNKNKILHRMLDYVKRLKGLNIRLEAVDASSSVDMAALIEPLKTPLGGCIILTAVLSDGAFQHLTEEDFSASFACKTGVLDTVKDTIDISKLEFLVAFSSVSGAFGIQGQTNYGAANTLLEQQMSLFPNGFTFICPGILDSSLMLAGGSDAAALRLNHLIDWSISAEDMIRWLDDAFCKHQNNHSFSRYIPHLDWEAMDGTHGMSKIGKHLVPAKSQSATRATAKSDIEGMADMICSALGILPNDFSAEVPLTTYGLDSLSASRLSFILRPIVEVTQIQLLADLSLNDIWRKVPASSSDVESKTIISTSVKTKTDPVAELLAKYAARIPDSTPLQDDMPVASSDQVILLTGSTGALGCNILYHLIENDVVKRIYAFNRRNSNGISLRDRQRDAFEAQGLPSSLVDSPKVTLLEGDLAASDFRVPTKVLDELLSNVTHVIHNAWRVDFVAPLADFEDLVEGTYGLLTFALRSKLPIRPSLSFISSIGVCQQFRGTSAVPEIPMIDPCIDLQTNYIKSKWVAERLFQIAGEKSLLRTNVIRVGLLSGGLNGFWDTSHWLPALVQSSSYVGCLPEGDEMISWIPINLAAAAIVDMRSVANETLHVIHPQPVTWVTVLEPLASLLDVPLVPFAEWHARLEHMHGADSHPNPSKSSSNDNMAFALKLTDFYRMGLNGGPQSSTESMGLLPKVASKKGFRASAALMDNRLVPLGPVDAQMWVRYWREVGFLPS